MADATPSRLGMINGTGADDALFLKQYGGEVLTAFEETCVTRENHVIRNIKNGKSASFPATWKTDARYHTPGTEIQGQVIKHNERIITIDDLLIADAFIPLIDEAKNHYEVRSIYSTENGRALANVFDKNVLRMGILAARAAATVDGGFGGTTIKNAAMASATRKDKADAIVDSIYAAAQVLDEKDVPESERVVYLRPAEYYAILDHDKVMNTDYSGGNGDYAKAKILEVAGIKVIKANHLPNDTVADSFGNKYDGDFTTTVGLVQHKSAVGTVKLLDLAMEGEYDIRRQGTLLVAKYAVGHGILRPECAVELSSAAA